MGNALYRVNCALESLHCRAVSLFCICAAFTLRTPQPSSHHSLDSVPHIRATRHTLTNLAIHHYDEIRSVTLHFANHTSIQLFSGYPIDQNATRHCDCCPHGRLRHGPVCWQCHHREHVQVRRPVDCCARPERRLRDHSAHSQPRRQLVYPVEGAVHWCWLVPQALQGPGPQPHPPVRVHLPG